MKMLGNSTYTIEYIKKVTTDDIPALPKSIAKTIKLAIEERLIIDPIGFGKPLRYSLKGHRRLRVGNYRIVYRIENQTVIISAIKHRKDIYQTLL